MRVLQDRNGFFQPHPHILGNKAVIHHFYFLSSLWMRSQHSTSSIGVVTSAAVKPNFFAVLPWGEGLPQYASNLVSILHQLHTGISPQPGWTSTNSVLPVGIFPGLHSLGFSPITMNWSGASSLTLLGPQPLPNSYLLILDEKVG